MVFSQSQLSVFVFLAPRRIVLRILRADARPSGRIIIPVIFPRDDNIPRGAGPASAPRRTLSSAVSHKLPASPGSASCTYQLQEARHYPSFVPLDDNPTDPNGQSSGSKRHLLTGSFSSVGVDLLDFLYLKAALTRSLNRGWALVGRDLSSG